MRSLVAAGMMTFGMTAVAAVFAADGKPTAKETSKNTDSTKKTPPVRARVVITATIGSAGGVGFAGMAVGGGFGGAGGNAPVKPAANLGVGGGVFGVAGGQLGQFGVQGGVGGGIGGVQGGGGAIGVMPGGAGGVGFAAGGAGKNLAIFGGVGGMRNPTMDMFLNIGEESGKNVILATIARGKAADFQKKFWQNMGWVMNPKPPVFAFSGRLTTEDEEKLFPNGAPVIQGPVSIELAEKKRLVLVVENVTAIDKFNKSKFPPQGQMMIEGKPACAKADLQLLDAETLAVVNDPVPVVIPGKKHESKLLEAKKIRVTGNLAVSEGKAKLQDTEEVKVIEKK